MRALTGTMITGVYCTCWQQHGLMGADSDPGRAWRATLRCLVAPAKLLPGATFIGFAGGGFTRAYL